MSRGDAESEALPALVAPLARSYPSVHAPRLTLVCSRARERGAEVHVMRVVGCEARQQGQVGS